MSNDTLSIKDNRTGRQYELDIRHGAIRATDLRQIRISEEDVGLTSYDPSLRNTASCQSRITIIDGNKGVLCYRGYPVDQLAERCTYLEVAYLILKGELPTRSQLDGWTQEVKDHTALHDSTKKVMQGFRHDVHPMGMLVSTIAALSTLYPDARDVEEPAARWLQVCRLVGKMPTIAAYVYRHSQKLPYRYPNDELSYTGNLMSMMFEMTGIRYQPNPVLERALDVLLILHADHEQNCSTNAMRSVGSSLADPYMCTAAAAAALYGPLHGSANEQVLRMLRKIGSKDKVYEYIQRVKTGEVPLMGFGHRVYKNYDPRARIIKQVANEILDSTGRNLLMDVALEIERIVLEDEYFISRLLYPSVEFYSGIVYQAMRFPVEMFPVLFAVPRTSGWLAQWEEMLQDPEQNMARPGQLYVGAERREVVHIERRT